MPYTKKMEYTAEDYISYKLQEGPLLVAKPKFDIDGTDLIAFVPDETEGRFSAKLGRIQSKGRSLRNTAYSSVEIPCGYVRNPYVLFVYIDYNKMNDLYMFFVEDIEKWEVRKDNYILSITRKAIDDGSMQGYLFDENKARKIVDIIRKTPSDLENELYRMLKMGQDAIKKQGEVTELADLLSKAALLQRDIEIQNGVMREVYLNMRLLAKDILQTAPADLVQRIKKYREDGYQEEFVFEEVLRGGYGLQEEVIWLMILDLYDSIEQKIMAGPLKRADESNS